MMKDRTSTTVRDDLFHGGGEMADRMRTFVWTRHPLGPADRWPQCLKTAVQIMLASRYPMFIWWGPTLINFYNDAYIPVLGQRHPTALGRRASDIWSEIWDVVGREAEQVMRGGHATWNEALLLVMERNGYTEETYFTWSYSPILDERGGVGGVFCACTEDTARVLSERRMRTLKDLAAGVVQTKTAREACEISSRALERNRHDLPFALIYLLQADRTRAELAGVSGLSEGAPACPAEIDLTASVATWPVAEVCATGERRLVDEVVARFGAVTRDPWPEPPSRAMILPLFHSGQDAPTGVLIAGISPRRLFDEQYLDFFQLVAGQVSAAIADGRSYEAERRRAESLAELDRAKTTFFSNVSHEFRTPLTLMLGPLEELLTRTDGDPSVKHQLDMVYRNSHRLLRLVNTLLDFSRIEAGRVQAVFEATDLARLTTDLVSIFRSATEQAGLKLSVDCRPLDQPVYVDRSMWEQIVLNLVSNAFKFTFEGEIVVSLRQVEGMVELRVRDTGVGIPVDEVPRLFERFHRVRNTRSRTHEGTGIGLALVQELLKLHGGTARVESRVGHGTTVLATVPLGSHHLPQEQMRAAGDSVFNSIAGRPFLEEALRWLPGPPANGLGEVSSGCHMPSIRASGRLVKDDRARVLVVDDNADMREYLTRLLEAWHDVTAVPDGEAALSAAREHRPSLILSDVMLPRLDGVGLLRELRADPTLRTIPIILVSARAGEESRVEGLAYGADDYLIKPFSARELLARVDAHLTMARVREQAAEEVRRRQEQLRGLAEAGMAIHSTLSLEEVLQLVTERARIIIGAHQALASVTVNHGEAQPLKAVSLSDRDAEEGRSPRTPDELALAERVCWENRVLRLSRAELEPCSQRGGVGEAGEPRPLRNWLAAPFASQDGRNLGVLQLFDKYEGDFTEQDEDILNQLAHMGSTAIETAQLFRRVEHEAAERQRVQEALEEKVRDLELFHDVVVGRELKMMELEKEVARLKADPAANSR